MMIDQLVFSLYVDEYSPPACPKMDRKMMLETKLFKIPYQKHENKK